MSVEVLMDSDSKQRVEVLMDVEMCAELDTIARRLSMPRANLVKMIVREWLDARVSAQS